MGDRSHADDQDRKEGGRFVASVTPEDVLAAFDDVEGPVVTSSDIAEIFDVTSKTAKSKLEELAGQGRVEGRETAGRTVWWRVDDDGEIVPDGGVTCQTLQCPTCGRNHTDWSLVGDETIPTRYGHGRTVELSCNQCNSGSVVINQ